MSTIPFENIIESLNTQQQSQQQSTDLPVKRDRDEAGKFLPNHGAYGSRARRRFSDLRTREGRQLAAILEELAADFGGYACLSAGQRLLLDQIRSKLIVLITLFQWIDEQVNAVKDGKLLPSLNQDALAFQNSLRRDIEALYKVKRPNLKKQQSLAEYMAEREKGQQ
ncbi:MAG TPA: hypothetical protein PKM59_02460 [Thermodesulfobacteriota bacterium]|nr:hypothetical protein [Thermodesulfobacteriota bacterium]HNU71791.1 hypothetical protein [Thermodesulfobacteriota bacterium]